MSDFTAGLMLGYFIGFGTMVLLQCLADVIRAHCRCENCTSVQEEAE